MVLPYELSRHTSGGATGGAVPQSSGGVLPARGHTVKRLLTDYSSAFRSKDFAAACEALSITHTFTRAGRQLTIGKAERFILYEPHRVSRRPVSLSQTGLA